MIVDPRTGGAGSGFPSATREALVDMVAAAEARALAAEQERDRLREAATTAVRRFELLACKRDRTDVDPAVGANELRAALTKDAGQ